MHRRINIKTDPLLDRSKYGFMNQQWPASWIGPVDYDPAESLALIFRRNLTLAKPHKVRVHIAADQRYELYIDQQYVARGAERSDLKNWVYESYALDLAAGSHLLTIRVWWVAPDAPAPEAQQTHRPALLVFGEGEANEILSTGVADWECQRLPGYRFHDHDRLNSFIATGAQLIIDGQKLDAEVERGQGAGWKKAEVLQAAALVANRWESTPWWILRPAWLPPMFEKIVHVGVARSICEPTGMDTRNLCVSKDEPLAGEAASWNRLLAGKAEVVIPPNTRRRVIVDLQDYYCAYPRLTCCGEGSTVRIQFAESLYILNDNGEATLKGNRDEIEGKVFRGFGIELTAGAECFTYSTHNFAAGRYIEIVISTANKPLRISGFELLDTHFPFKFTSSFTSSESAHAEMIPVALRTIEMCSHDTSMDCPYYERLNYVGDTRLQALVAYVAADEERLSRKCIELFDLSRRSTGLNYSRYPTRTIQTIPTFSLWWTAMVYDYALWRNDPTFVVDRMLGVRAILEAWRGFRSDNGLLQAQAGWNFVDWVPTWPAGVPADGHEGYSSILNLQAIYALRKAAELEDFVNEPLLARRHRQFADDLAKQVHKRFFDQDKGLLADDLAHKHFSEHAQCLAVLSGTTTGAAAAKLIKNMLATNGLAQATIYFSHYLFEALGQVHEVEALLARLETWNTLKLNGFRTTFEAPEPTRSDCHAWGAHPVYHFLATIAGIRPAAFGFESVIIRPQLGTLTSIKGKMPHRLGAITFDIQREGKKLLGTITLPEGLKAILEVDGKHRKLSSGVNQLGTSKAKARTASRSA